MSVSPGIRSLLRSLEALATPHRSRLQAAHKIHGVGALGNSRFAIEPLVLVERACKVRQERDVVHQDVLRSHSVPRKWFATHRQRTDKSAPAHGKRVGELLERQVA